MAVNFLSEKQAKILSNKTAKKILASLDKRKPTSQIAKDLNLPLTTVDYNISQLEKAGLIKSGYYKWSKRGNKMKLYEPSGEILIYAPEEKQMAIVEALNKFVVPVVLAVAGGFGFIVQKLFYGKSLSTLVSKRVMDESVEQSVMNSDMLSAPVATGATDVIQNATNVTVEITKNTIVQTEPQLWFWFMLSAGLVLLVLYLYKKLRNDS
jgi:DNA-binding transcriptional ArsR family regulator